MADELEAECNDLREMTNEQLVEHALRSDSLTQLETELTLRLEAFIDIHGDHLVPGS